jgi:hypothetical protein
MHLQQTIEKFPSPNPETSRFREREREEVNHMSLGVLVVASASCLGCKGYFRL